MIVQTFLFNINALREVFPSLLLWGGFSVEIRTGEEVRVLAEVTNWALERNVDLFGLTVERMTLEDVYLHYVGPEGSA